MTLRKPLRKPFQLKAGDKFRIAKPGTEELSPDIFTRLSYFDDSSNLDMAPDYRLHRIQGNLNVVVDVIAQVVA